MRDAINIAFLLSAINCEIESLFATRMINLVLHFFAFTQILLLIEVLLLVLFHLGFVGSCTFS